jgi:hypothetical protein
VWLPNRIELFAAELCAVAEARSAHERATMRRRSALPADPVRPSRTPADPRVEEPRGFALRRNYAKGSPASPSFSKHALQRGVCRRSGARGRAASPTYAGENCENLRMRGFGVNRHGHKPGVCRRLCPADFPYFQRKFNAQTRRVEFHWNLLGAFTHVENRL